MNYLIIQAQKRLCNFGITMPINGTKINVKTKVFKS
jgi:hypothetical protein